MLDEAVSAMVIKTWTVAELGACSRSASGLAAYSRPNLDELHSGHEERPSLPLAMGRPDAHAGYNGGAVGRARRLQHRRNIPAPALVPTPFPSMS